MWNSGRRATRRSGASDGIRKAAESLLLGRFERFVCKGVQANDSLRRTANRMLINGAIGKMEPRPAPLSTRDPYTSWASLTDRTYDGRHLPPVPIGADDLPSTASVADLFLREEGTVPCPKSTLLFAYFAQWFTDGFLRSDRSEARDPAKNDATHDIDLCQIYGVRTETTHELREHTDGLLKSEMLDDEEFPPYLYRNGKKAFSHVSVARESEALEGRKADFYAIGTDTANVQIGHVMLNVLFLREHNRIARELHCAYPSWHDERLFQTARNILIVLLIKISIEEYINHITPYRFEFFLDDPSAFQRAGWYRQNRMASEFNILYRWHSLVPSRLNVGGGAHTIEETTFNSALMRKCDLGRLFEEASSQHAGRVGLFNTDPFLRPAEIATIEKGRKVHLASYNDYRAHCGFPRVTEFSQISSDSGVQERLGSLYGDVDRVEFYPGLFAENAPANSVLPALMGTMVASDAFSQALTNPLLAPRVFNPSTFSPLGWHTIHTTSRLSHIVNRNPKRNRNYTVAMTRADWRRQ